MEEDAYCYQEFMERQSIKGKKGATVANEKGACSLGGKIRSEKYSEIRKEAHKLKGLGFSNTDISVSLNVSRRTIIRWFNEK